MTYIVEQILVDVKAEALLLPIYGYLVPFHISIVKNASKTDDYLRINFVTPTAITAQSQVLSKLVVTSRSSALIHFTGRKQGGDVY